jgi:hypothetical protein
LAWGETHTPHLRRIQRRHDIQDLELRAFLPGLRSGSRERLQKFKFRLDVVIVRFGDLRPQRIDLGVKFLKNVSLPGFLKV